MENPSLGMAGFGERDGLPRRRHNSSFDLSSPVMKRAETVQEDVFHSTAESRQLDRPGRRPLRVMKFGGTSVGDASCIEKVVEIIREASQECDVVVVVSAMSSVTNKLIEAATQSEAGNRGPVA